MGLEKFEARLVVSIVSIDVGEQRPGVDDQSDEPNSAARISSIRSEISVRPLAPAPAARSRLRPVRPPRCASIASLVSSEIVVPRRCASWRRRASRSSGSFTVVRIMYASIPDARRRRSLHNGPRACARDHLLKCEARSGLESPRDTAPYPLPSVGYGRRRASSLLSEV